MTYSKNLAIITAITEGQLTQTQAAKQFGVSTRWIRTLLKRYKTGGKQALHPQSKTPHNTPTQTPQQIQQQIIQLRKTLTTQGLDAGPTSIKHHLPPNSPSTTTIWRILHNHHLITPQPQKRPRSSWHRFEADLPNECWQSDFTYWQLADNTTIQIISWLDDHSRYLIHISAHQSISTRTVIETFTTAQDKHGLPASTLTDNGTVYTTRLTGGRKEHTQPNAFEKLLSSLSITQKNGKPYHPTTQGKIERFHQTLKRWLAAHPAAETIEELNHLLADFQHIYNTQRPHRALHGKTPHHAYTATPKATPTIGEGRELWRVRYDKINNNGTITMRFAGKLVHLGVGRTHKGERVIALVDGPRVMVVYPSGRTRAGEIIATFIIDPKKNYQKQAPLQP